MKRAGVLSFLLMGILSAGCFVEVRKVDDPRAAFDHARAEAAEIARRPGRAQEVHVLVYEPSDQEIVKVSVPMWMARKIAKHEGGDIDSDDETGGRLRRHLEHRLRFEDLEKAGRGLILEAFDDDGSQVLVWLR